MSNIYVKLKEEYYKEKGAKAIDVYGQLIYPGNDRWVVYDEKWLELIKKHRNYESLEIKTQDVINEEKKKDQESIEQLVTGHWKSAEKEINKITNKQKLNDIKKAALANGREAIVKLVDGRLEELSL